MRTILAADMHLKPGVQPEQNKMLREFFAEISGSQRLILLGDAFNAWFEKGGRCVGDFSECLQIFKEAADSGLEIFHICGNRDFAIGSSEADSPINYRGYFSFKNNSENVSLLSKNGITPCGMRLEFTQGSKRYLCAHGDQYCTYESWHQLLRWFFMGLPSAISAYYLPFFVPAFFVKFAQKRDAFPHMGIVPFANNIQDAAISPYIEKGVDEVFCGHFHRNESREVASKSRKGVLRIIDCWVQQGVYAVLDEEEFTVKKVGG